MTPEEHADAISAATAALNSVIRAASDDGLVATVSVLEINRLDRQAEIPFITTMLVKPLTVRKVTTNW